MRRPDMFLTGSAYFSYFPTSKQHRPQSHPSTLYSPSSPHHPQHSDSFPRLQRQSFLPTKLQARKGVLHVHHSTHGSLPSTGHITPPFHPPARTPRVASLSASQTRRRKPVHESRGDTFRQERRMGDGGRDFRCKFVGERRGRRSATMGPIECDSVGR